MLLAAVGCTPPSDHSHHQIEFSGPVMGTQFTVKLVVPPKSIDVGKLAVDVAARLNIGALPDQVVTGRLSRIAPQAKEEEGARLFDVEIELDLVDRGIDEAGHVLEAHGAVVFASSEHSAGGSVDADRLARAAGSGRAANSVLLGAASGKLNSGSSRRRKSCR